MAFTVAGASAAAVRGRFYTFGSATPVFPGTVKSSYLLAGESDRSSQESFQATKR